MCDPVGKSFHVGQGEFQNRLAQIKEWIEEASDDQRTTMLAAIQVRGQRSNCEKKLTL